MKFRRNIRIVSLLLILIAVLVGLVKVNMVNSKILSPLNNNYNNLDLDEKKLYEKYSDFIKDNTYLKIYKESNRKYLIKLGKNDYIVDTGLGIKGTTKNIFNKIEELFKGL